MKSGKFEMAIVMSRSVNDSIVLWLYNIVPYLKWGVK